METSSTSSSMSDSFFDFLRATRKMDTTWNNTDVIAKTYRRGKSLSTKIPKIQFFPSKIYKSNLIDVNQAPHSSFFFFLLNLILIIIIETTYSTFNSAIPMPMFLPLMGMPKMSLKACLYFNQRTRHAYPL